MGCKLSVVLSGYTALEDNRPLSLALVGKQLPIICYKTLTADHCGSVNTGENTLFLENTLWLTIIWEQLWDPCCRCASKAGSTTGVWRKPTSSPHHHVKTLSTNVNFKGIVQIMPHWFPYPLCTVWTRYDSNRCIGFVSSPLFPNANVLWFEHDAWKMLISVAWLEWDLSHKR